MMRRMAAITLSLAACTPAQPVPPGPPVLPGGACRTDGLDALTGKPATPDLIARAKAMSGAGIVRTARPGQPMTMDYRQNRLNIRLDEAGKVTRFTCG